MKNTPSYLLLGILTILLFSFCNKKNSQLSNKKTNTSMTTNDYTADWKEIDSLQNQGLPKSALEKLDVLYKKVIKKNDHPQIAKCLIYKGKYMVQLEEDGFVKALNYLVEEEKNADMPLKAMLQSMLGEQYSMYVNRNYYRMNNRTETPDYKTDDIRTWTVGQLSAESNNYFLKSVNNKSTRKINIKNWEAILTQEENSEQLRPTLYDFLAHRALNFLMNESSYLTEPVYKFYIEDEVAIGDANAFVNHKFVTKDSISTKYQTILLFQEIIQQHLDDETPDALIDVDLKRLRFVKSNGVMDGKDDLYYQSLERLQKKYDSHSASTEVLYQMARYYFDKGNTYQPNPDETGKFDLKTAYDLCSQAMNQARDSYGANQCANLQTQILRKNIIAQMGQVNLPNEPMLASIAYKNVDKVFLKVIRLEEKDRRKLNDRETRRDMARFLNSLSTVKEWSLDLPQDGDYREHRVEAKIDGLPFGYYAILVANNNAFTDKGNAVAYMFTHVSNLSFMTRRDKENQTEFFVVHRKTGEPLNNVKADYFVREYNSKSRKYDFIDRGNGKTDKDGYLKPQIGEQTNFQIRWSLGDDVLNLDDSYSNYNYRNEPQAQDQTHLFLDRAIYRPGQTVYFKGILTNVNKERMPKILPSEKVVITFHDANNQEVEKQTLTTNEYGTFNGTLTAPKSGLLGRMYITTSRNGRKFFRVEEYKRPKFEVNFEPVKVSYKIGDEVKVEGLAKAYAGSNVDGAKVTYRVVRETIYPYWRHYYWRGYFPPSESMEITNGETTTDENGKFVIPFTAVPDRSASVKNKPQFNYKVIADVIDITGETHSSETNVSVGYIALNINIDIAQKIDRNDLGAKGFKITSENLNGEFENAQGEIVVHQLESSNKIFRKRYWSVPDKYLMSEAEFNADFPNDVYKDENQLQNWKVGKEVLKTRFDVSRNSDMVIGTPRWEVGSYVLTLNTQDKYGEKIELKKYFTLYDLKQGKIPSNMDFLSELDKKKYEPNEIAKYFAASAYKSINVLHEVEFENKVIERKWLTVNGLKSLSLPILEKHRGNLGYHLSFVKNNRSFIQSKTIQVPWSNKDLKFEYSTFRDKLLPGQKEEWRIKISGNKKEKVAAEMVAAMYDASLDEFASNTWNMNLFPTNYIGRTLRSSNFRSVRSNLLARDWQSSATSLRRYYRNLNWFGFSSHGRGGRMMKRELSTVRSSAPPPPVIEEVAEEDMEMAMPMSADTFIEKESKKFDAGNTTLPLRDGRIGESKNEGQSNDDPNKKPDFSKVKVRTNLDETVFFLPEIMTDANGDVIVKFTMNEALTRWKFLGLAHTKDLKFGFTEKEIVTQKELMVLPNAPRFMREGDEIEFTAKVSNLTKKEMAGSAQLELFDALTMQPVDILLGNDKPTVSFTAGAGQSARLAWNLKIPHGKVMAITHRVVAQAGEYSDGEESSLPVVTNRMLVTETMPLPVRGNQTKQFKFDRLANANSSSLQHHEMTLEFTSNPAWYAVQALPYLMEYPHQCTEQIFSRYYANSLATNVANSHPKVKSIFEQWKNTDAMLSNLSKNQELKSALLEETPWVLAAQSEEEQKKNIGLLFDLNRMSEERAEAVKTIADRQLNNGGFSWFPGGRDSWYITQYIVEGMGHLNELGVEDIQNDPKVAKMINRAVVFIDNRIAEQYEELLRRVKEGNAKLEDDHLNNMAIHYLYARSFFANQQMDGNPRKAHAYYLGQAKKYWLNKGMYQEGMIALALHRNDEKDFTKKMIKSLRERALHNDEMGMYWKYDRGYFWYQMPIETHALMIEVFDEVANDAQAVDDLKVYLLKTKQTTHWKTTKATSAAVYALLRRGANWLLEDTPVEITLGNQKIDQSKMDTEAGTGYFKTKWKGDEVTTSMANVEVKNPNDVVAWGALYWQYFEDLDKITHFEETPLKLNKKLFKMENSDRGPVMTELKEGAQLSPGDKVQVRIELRVDRPMEYVHMKDMRASGFEPLNVLSQYKWQGGLGYYESTKDLSTNFFIAYLPKGTFVFEYPLVVNHKGNFSNGVTTIQCMYAPEFTSHSEGIRVSVE